MAALWLVRATLFNLIVAFIFSAISLLAPYWYHEDPYTYVGLWGKCIRKEGCTWGHERHAFWFRIQPGWWFAVIVLMCLGVFTQFICIILTVRVHWGKRVNMVVRSINAAFLILAFLEITIAVGHFGRMTNIERGVIIDEDDDASYRNFSWAFLLGCLGAFFDLFASIFFLWFFIKDYFSPEKQYNYQGDLAYAQQQAQLYPPHPQQQQMYA